jgi:hypothetical protein
MIIKELVPAAQTCRLKVLDVHQVLAVMGVMGSSPPPPTNVLECSKEVWGGGGVDG